MSRPVRPLTSSAKDAAGAAAVLKDAFAADPIMRALLPGDVYENHADTLYRKHAGLAAAAGASYVLEDEAGDVKCVALWELPEAPGVVRVLPRLLGVFAWCVWTLGVRTTVRLLKFQQFMESENEKHAGIGAYKLTDIGTAKDFRGRGAGNAIMAPMLARADAERKPCFLGSSNPRNLTFYKRLGFEVVAEAYPLKDWPDLEGDGPVMTFMYRAVPPSDDASDDPGAARPASGAEGRD
mmetsp:Transcript_8726/g.36103  ORF Transcript_8726/g.36103 Transcript_8726/m.36103 type:complete len:238 (-) Transcript_8726:137-850(-)